MGGGGVEGGGRGEGGGDVGRGGEGVGAGLCEDVWEGGEWGRG